MVYAMGFHVTIIVHFFLVVFLKWLLLGRFKAGVGDGSGSCFVRLLSSPRPNTALEQVYNRTFNLRLRVFLVDFAADVLRRTVLTLWCSGPTNVLWARALGGKIGRNCSILSARWIAPSTADLIDISSDVFISGVAADFETTERGLGLQGQDMRTRHMFRVGSGSELGFHALFLPGCEIGERCSIGTRVGFKWS